MYDYESNPEAKGVEYQVTTVDPTDPTTKGKVYQVHKVSEEVAATLGGKVYRARIINDPTEPTVAGKVYQIVLIGDPTDPAVKGKVYNAILTGGSEAVVVGPAVSPLVLPDAIANSLSYVKAFGGTEQGLPDDYTQLEYIESSGTQYINTGLKLTQDNTVEVEYNYHTASNIATSGRMFGARYTSAPRNAFAVGTNTGRVESSTKIFAQLDEISSTAANNITIGQWNTYKISIDGFYINDVLQGSFSATTFETPFTVKLFAFEQASSSSGTPSVGCGVGRCRRFKVYQGDVLVMDLIPAKNPTDDIGMYDLIRGQFFTNAGTGDFIAGAPVDPVLPTPDAPMDIVSNNGVLKVNSQGQIYTVGTVETITDALSNTATAEMLLKVGDYQDEQEILSGVVTRKVGVKVLDGTENWWRYGFGRFATPLIGSKKQDLQQAPISSHFIGMSHNNVPPTDGRVAVFNGSIAPTSGTLGINYQATLEVEQFKQWLANQYAAGTPVIVVFPLATPTTESVAGQALQVTDGDNVLEITQASLARLELEAQYNAAVSLTIQEVQDANLDPNVQVTIN